MKHLIVLVIDGEDFQKDHHDGEPCTPETLLDLGRSVNDDAASIYGYESWIVAHDVDKELIDQLAKLNIPDTGEIVS